MRHGHAKNGKLSGTYVSWSNMKRRCTNPNDNRFKTHGARGVTVCARWQSFSNFLADMGERPDGLSIERINVNGNYEPSNCKWATPTEQARNRTNNKLNASTARQVKLLEEMGYPKRFIARAYNVSQRLVQFVSRNQAWA